MLSAPDPSPAAMPVHVGESRAALHRAKGAVSETAHAWLDSKQDDVSRPTASRATTKRSPSSLATSRLPPSPSRRPRPRRARRRRPPEPEPSPHEQRPDGERRPTVARRRARKRRSRTSRKEATRQVMERLQDTRSNPKQVVRRGGRRLMCSFKVAIGWASGTAFSSAAIAAATTT